MNKKKFFINFILGALILFLLYSIAPVIILFLSEILLFVVLVVIAILSKEQEIHDDYENRIKVLKSDINRLETQVQQFRLEHVLRQRNLL